MDIFNSSHQSKSSQKTKKATNFIEALKDIGSSSKQQTKDLVFGPKADRAQEDNKSENFNFEDYLKSKERQIASQEKQKYQRKIEEERLVFHRKQEEAKLQIKAVQNELKKLADTTQGLSQEVKKATLKAVVEPGTYHENFFDKIRKLIELARKKVAESKSWMETFNQRSKRKSHYWGQVKKSGTKYMLSQERSIATRVG